MGKNRLLRTTEESVDSHDYLKPASLLEKPTEPMNAPAANQTCFCQYLYADADNMQANREDAIAKLLLLHQNERLQQFEYMASHNLRGPVATILGLTQLLGMGSEKKGTNDQDEQIIRYLKQTALELDSIIKDLQQVLGQQHRADQNKELVSIQEIISKVSGELKDAILNTNTGILADYSKANKLFGVRSSLYNIFYQLISNAIKYRNPACSPLIVLDVEVKDGFTYVSITDNGLGLDINRFGHKLFNPYSRFHSHVDGKGLGLHLARTLLRQMGGDITLQSEPGKGTVCTFYIPA